MLIIGLDDHGPFFKQEKNTKQLGIPFLDIFEVVWSYNTSRVYLVTWQKSVQKFKI